MINPTPRAVEAMSFETRLRQGGLHVANGNLCSDVIERFGDGFFWGCLGRPLLPKEQKSEQPDKGSKRRPKPGSAKAKAKRTKTKPQDGDKEDSPAAEEPKAPKRAKTKATK